MIFRLSIFLLALPLYITAQTPSYLVQELYWLRYANTLSLNENWQLYGEAETRNFVQNSRLHQFMSRLIVQRRFDNGKWDVASGICYFLNAANEPAQTNHLIVPEWRPFVEVNQRTGIGTKLKIMHRYRAEERFIRNTNNNELIDGYRQNGRFRYMLQLNYPIDKAEKISVRVFNEWMLNYGRSIQKNNIFDQNRFFGGFLLKILPNLHAEIGLLRIHQYPAAKNLYYNRYQVR